MQLPQISKKPLIISKRELKAFFKQLDRSGKHRDPAKQACFDMTSFQVDVGTTDSFTSRTRPAVFLTVLKRMNPEFAFRIDPAPNNTYEVIRGGTKFVRDGKFEDVPREETFKRIKALIQGIAKLKIDVP